MTVVKQSLAAAFVLVIGFIATGCGDSATVNPEVELSRLTVSPGTLQPAFSGGTTQYSVDLTSSTTSVTVSAQPAVSGDTVSINGQATTSRVITLGAAGTTTSVNIVVSESGSNSRTYTVLLRRAGLAGNNSLESLAVSPGTLAPTFNANELIYTVDVANTVESVSVTPTLQDTNATMTVNGQNTDSGQSRSITLNPAGQSTAIRVIVTAQNGTPKTYLVTVSRGISSNNNLQSLIVSPGTLTPAFSDSTLDYTVDVANTVGSVSITPTRQDPDATITVNGQAATSGQARSITLNPAGQSTLIRVIVTAQNGSQKTYLVTVSRGISSNNNLQSLAVSPGTLAPTFNANNLSYTVNVANTVGSVSVTPTRQDPDATITVNGQAATSGQARTITLNGPGQNTTITITVTAQNGGEKTYLVTVSRGVSANNNLRSLTISPGTLTPTFNAGTEDYTVNVASTVASVSITPTRQDPDAAITVNGQATNSGQARTITLRAAGLSTLISIVVTAQNGGQKTYVVSVNRAALGGNNNLSALTVTAGSAAQTLSPAFAASTLNYTVNVASTVTSVVVSATKSDSNAVMSDDVTAGAGIATGQATIQLGGQGTATVVLITVTAPNGSSKTYRITVNRAALASNNNLSALSVIPGSLSPGFASGTLNYTVGVATEVSSINVSATKADANAVMSGDVTAGTGLATGQANIPLDGPGTSKVVRITVIAPNGDSKTYNITVNRAAAGGPAVPAAPSTAPDLIPEDDSCPRDAATNACLPGTSDGDNITNVNTPRFRIPQPEAGQTPNLYVDGTRVDSTFDQAANTLRPTAALSDGDHTITSTVTNAAGSESPQSPALTVTIDTVAPGNPGGG